MTWTPAAYHKIVMTDLQQLAQEIGSYSGEQSYSAQRYQFREICRFANKIVTNSILAIKLLNELDRRNDAA